MNTGKREVSTGRLLVLIFLPAALVLLFYMGALNFRDKIPPLLSFILIGIFVLLPFELFIILRSSKKEYGSYSLRSAFEYNNKLAIGNLLIKYLVLFGVAGLVAAVIGNLENKLMAPIISRLVPDYFRLDDFVNQKLQYSSAVILITCIFYVAANAFILPIVEELYFRGYLMPRIERFGKLAPLIITLLFSLYHFWAPWQNLLRIFAIFPYTYSVWKNRNIYIGILVHCSINLISCASLLYTIYGR